MFNCQIKNDIQVCAKEDQPNILYIVVLHGFKWISNTLPHEYQYPIRNQMSWSNTNAPTPTQVCRERNKMADELANNCFGWQIIVLINFIKDNLDMKNL